MLRSKDISDFYQRIRQPDEQFVGVVAIMKIGAGAATAVAKSLAMGVAGIGYSAAGSGSYVVIGASHRRVVLTYMTPMAKMGSGFDISYNNIVDAHFRDGIVNRVMQLRLADGRVITLRIGRWAIGHSDHSKRYEQLKHVVTQALVRV